MPFLDQLKALKLRRPGATPVVEPAAASEESAPLFLDVGSLTGVTRKDALAFARGLAESNVTTPSQGRLQVWEDKANARWVYEVHEGGTEFSIAQKVVEALGRGDKVCITLANGASLTVEEASGGELFSLVHQPAADAPEPRAHQPDLFGHEDAHAQPARVVEPSAAASDGPAAAVSEPVSRFAGRLPLLELFPEDKSLSQIGLGMLGVSFTLFIALGLGYTVVSAGLFDKDALLTLSKAGYVADASDNPVWQLAKARSEADKAGTHIKALKKGPSGWSWELAQ